jgi:TonB family protein
MLQSLKLLILIFFYSVSFSQNNETSKEYFDSEWRPVKFEKDSKYYRISEAMGNRFIVKDYFTMGNQLQMEAECKSIKPELVFDGIVKFYNEDGNPVKTLLYSDNSFKYLQYWSKSGNELLSNGSGIITEKSDVGYDVVIEVKDSTVFLSYSFRPDKGDTIFSKASIPAEFPGGFPAFYKIIGTTIKYPKEARRNGTQGKVFVQFIINKAGEMEEIKILKGIGSGCDEETEMCIRNITSNWVAASHDNKRVKSMMVLPVIFKLGK